jgi:type II secretory pathway component PulL
MRAKKKWSALRTPVQLPTDEQTNLQPYRRAIMIIFLVGALAVAGQYVRLQHYGDKVAGWRTRTQSLYSSLFGPSPGPDPYGKLLYTLNQLQRTQSKGVNVLGILAALSEQPPKGLTIENLNFSTDSGSVMGRAESYDALENYLKTLNSDSDYAFTLEQAANTKDGIQFHLRVTITQ